MKKSFLFAALVVIMCAFSSCDDSSLLSKQEERKNSISGLKKEKDKDKEVNWELVALADGTGAYYGVKLTKSTRNLRVILASAVGFGVYASIDEYDRQKEELDNDNEEVIYYPYVINPYNPFISNPLTNDLQYTLNNEYGNVGEAHNLLLQSQLELYSMDSILDMETIFYDTYTQAFQIYDQNVEEVTLSLSELHLNAQQKCDESWSLEKEEFTVNYPYFETLLTEYPIEDVLCYIKSVVQEDIEVIDSSIVLMSVAYYSKCLWNTMAPSPTMAQECVVWSASSETLQFVTGRSNVVESIVNKEDDQYIFFPAYNQDGVVALYLYTGLSQFGASEYISDINVLSDLHAESSCFNNITIDISCGTYSVEPTTSSDVYVISFL